MPLFTFYPCRADGSATAFESLECPSDAAAMAHAERVLREHLSSVEVVVWRGDRRVGALARVAERA